MNDEDYFVDADVCEWPLCTGQRTVTINVNSGYIFLECLQTSCRTVEINVKLRELPLFLNIGSKKLTLKGAVGFIGGTSNAVGHYVGLSRRNDNWQCINDLRTSVTSVSVDKTICLHLLVYSQ